MTVEIGQIWADMDTRRARRELRVIEIEDSGRAVCMVSAVNGVLHFGDDLVKIQISRMKPTTRGFELLADEDTTVGKLRKFSSAGKPILAEAQLNAIESFVGIGNAPMGTLTAADVQPLKPSLPEFDLYKMEEFVTLVHERYPAESDIVNAYYERHAKEVWDYMMKKIAS